MYTDNLLTSSWTGAGFATVGGVTTIQPGGYIEQVYSFLTPIITLEEDVHLSLGGVISVAPNVFVWLKYQYFDTTDIFVFPVHTNAFTARSPIDGQRILSGFTYAVLNNSGQAITTQALSVVRFITTLEDHVSTLTPHGLPLAITVGQHGIKGTKGTDVTFWLKDTGDLSLAGDITMTGGSINWNVVNKPSVDATLPAYIKSTYIDATTVMSPTIRGGTMEVGGAWGGLTLDDVFKVTADGIHLGHNLFAEAPFSVDMDGRLIATDALITGTIIGSNVYGGSIYSTDSDPLITPHIRIENNTLVTYNADQEKHGLELTPGYADIHVWSNGREIFTIYNPVDGGVNLNAHGSMLITAGVSDPTKAIIMLGGTTKVVHAPEPAVAQVRNIHVSTAAPTPEDGINGDIWFKYTP